MKSPDKTLFFFFRSIPKELNDDIWIVRVVLPPNAGADTFMDVENGKGTLAYGDFVKGMGETAVWMFRPGREPVPGGLTFG